MENNYSNITIFTIIFVIVEASSNKLLYIDLNLCSKLHSELQEEVKNRFFSSSGFEA